MSQAQLERKVRDYLRNSQALEGYWHQPITAEQLQTEMDRMAQHTRQPEVLRELFEALGNDPFVIAECLARPVLAERLVRELKNEEKVAAIDSTPKAFGVQLNRPYQLPVIGSPSGGCIDDTWTATSTSNAPDARTFHTAVWTGSEMIVWGGQGGTGITFFNTGGRYHPSVDSWTPTSTTNAPEARRLHTAVWTGSEMIVWGGVNESGDVRQTGGRYNPITDSWTATSITNAPTARTLHTAVWTGSDMIVWGGFSSPIRPPLNTGGRYDPSTDSWTATTTTNAPTGRSAHTAVWTHSEMIIWGGFGGLNTGGRYDRATDSWTPTSLTNAPAGREFHTAIWTGSEMIIWGGSGLNTGGRYDPGTDSWSPTSLTNAPTARTGHTAVWTSSEMVIWGGVQAPIYLNTGGRYNPGTDSWTATSITNAPTGRDGHTAVWTDTEMVIWGGGNLIPIFFNTGGRYCAQAGPTPSATATPTATPTTTPMMRPTPTPRPRPTPAPRP
jgi:hypothetical protein